VGAVGGGLAFWAVCVVPGLVFLVFAGRRGEVRRFVLRLAPVGAFYGVYALLVGFTERASVVRLALGHAVDVWTVERRFGLAWEPWISRHVPPFANGFYGAGMAVVTLGLVTWLALGEDDRFWRYCRDSLAVIAAGGFLVYWLFPVAPPWLLPSSFGIHSLGLPQFSGVGELLGAMPSLHTAWAGWAAVTLWAVLPYRWRFVGFVNLAVTAVVVLATGNHFVLDVVAGECLAMFGSWCAERFARIRERYSARRVGSEILVRL
jgi:hypothetical protein